MAPDFGAKSALLLQGPNGPFFRRFADELSAKGIAVTKVNFHAGDALYFHDRRAVAFRGKADEFPAFIEQLIDERKIDALYVFGDGRPYHRVAVQIAKRRGLHVWVFEEGYLRPDWITLEADGVNGYSTMPRDPNFFRKFAREHVAPAQHEQIGKTFGVGAFYATVLAMAATLAFYCYPRYHHHRSINSWYEMTLWIRGAFRKYWYRFLERNVLVELIRRRNKRYFLVALQVYCDYQIVHSRFESVEQFIDEVMKSFAEHAPRDCSLVFKHHPMDRAYRDYTKLLRKLALQYGVADRVVYVHDLHLPSLLRCSRGAVMINSTVGLQSASYGTPVKILGDAVYDMPGLTYQGSLQEFWNAPGEVDTELYQAFRTYLLCTNQANGAYAKRLKSLQAGAGIHWF